MPLRVNRRNDTHWGSRAAFTPSAAWFASSVSYEQPNFSLTLFFPARERARKSYDSRLRLPITREELLLGECPQRSSSCSRPPVAQKAYGGSAAANLFPMSERRIVLLRRVKRPSFTECSFLRQTGYKERDLLVIGATYPHMSQTSGLLHKEVR